jgi:hypothetical protein
MRYVRISRCVRRLVLVQRAAQRLRRDDLARRRRERGRAVGVVADLVALALVARQWGWSRRRGRGMVVVLLLLVVVLLHGERELLLQLERGVVQRVVDDGPVLPDDIGWRHIMSSDITTGGGGDHRHQHASHVCGGRRSDIRFHVNETTTLR